MHDPSDHRAALGKRGEEIVSLHLAQSGMDILARNFACLPLGELDIVARDGETVVFVEVKSRVGQSGLRQAIGSRQTMRLKRMAKIFLDRRGCWEVDYRFLLFYVVFVSPSDQKPQLLRLDDPF